MGTLNIHIIVKEVTVKQEGNMGSEDNLPEF
jgi:hypothetical protein